MAPTDSEASDVERVVRLDDASFRELFAGSPIKRIGVKRMLRNCLIAAGNSGDHSLLPRVEALCGDEDPVVAEAARWALQQLSSLSRSDGEGDHAEHGGGAAARTAAAPPPLHRLAGGPPPHELRSRGG